MLSRKVPKGFQECTVSLGVTPKRLPAVVADGKARLVARSAAEETAVICLYGVPCEIVCWPCRSLADVLALSNSALYHLGRKWGMHHRRMWDAVTRARARRP